MHKLHSILIIIGVSTFLTSCSSYYLASYYENDGIYYTNQSSNYYKGVFDEYSQLSLDDTQNDVDTLSNLPWGANPDSVEVIYNFPHFGRFYYNPFFHDMSFNPFFNAYGRFINYGYTSLPFYYNSYAYEMGYPFFPRPIDFYLNPYSNFIGNYYWYYFNRSRWFYPGYYRGLFNSKKYNDSYADSNYENTKPGYSNSASRRGEKSTEVTSNVRNSSSMRISGIYSGDRVIQNPNFESPDDAKYDRGNTRNLGEINENTNIPIYRSRQVNSSRNLPSLNSVPNLSRIKNEALRDSYRRIRSIRTNTRNSNSYKTGFENDYNYTRGNSNRSYQRSNNNMSNTRSNNSSYSSSRSSSRSSGFSSRSSNGVSRSSASGSTRAGKID